MSDACRAGVFAHYECLVLKTIYIHGWFVPVESAIFVGGLNETIKEYPDPWHHPLLSYTAICHGSNPEEVAAVGKEQSAAGVFIWFLCAIAFLKVSQKIDSFMASLGVNVGRTGGSMMAELMIAARGITSVKSLQEVPFSAVVPSRAVRYKTRLPFIRGLVGAVGRHITQSTVNTMTGHTSNPISRKIYESSLNKGGAFANNITAAIAQGSMNMTGSMQGEQAAKALSSYMGHVGKEDAPSFSGVEIGGGRIMGTETSIAHPNGDSFGMYSSEQYMTPRGNYDTVTMQDNSVWYRQYAAPTVEKTPYMTPTGEIAYHETVVRRLPDMPKRKDKV